MRRTVLALSIVIPTVLGPAGSALARTEATSAPVSLSVTASRSNPTRPLVHSPDWTAEANQVRAWLGYSVSSAGDVNGDGYDDAIGGAYRYDAAGRTDAGRADVYYGSASGLSLTPAWTGVGDWNGAFFGHSVSTAGDVNGDGYDDIIVGAPNPTNTDKLGRAYAYYGSASGLSLTPNWTAVGDQAVAWFGRRVHTAGDVNGDGYDDVIVGAPHEDDPDRDEGEAFVYYGSPSGLSTTPSWTAEDDQAWSLFARDAKGAGDVNGDGYDDVIIGAHFYDGDQLNEGKAWIYFGSASGLSATPGWSAEGNQRDAWFGRSIATAGDVNRDGYADVVVGAPKLDDPEVDEGESFVYYGSPTGPSITADWTAEADQSDAWFGRSVARAGDVNGDGYTDVIIGAPNYDANPPSDSDDGKVFVYYGSASGLSPSPNWTRLINQDHAWYGRSVATAGDVNGDGFDDIIIGAPQFDHPQHDEGMVFAFYGSARGL
jgi:hypothetical protein